MSYLTQEQVAALHEQLLDNAAVMFGLHQGKFNPSFGDFRIHVPAGKVSHAPTPVQTALSPFFHDADLHMDGTQVKMSILPIGQECVVMVGRTADLKPASLFLFEKQSGRWDSRKSEYQLAASRPLIKSPSAETNTMEAA